MRLQMDSERAVFYSAQMANRAINWNGKAVVQCIRIYGLLSQTME